MDDYEVVEQLLERAGSLALQFRQEGESRYIDEAIVYDREALSFCTSSEDPFRPICLILLSTHLCARYKQLGEIGNLNEAIDLNQDALELCPLGHPGRSTSLNNLATNIYARYKQLGGAEDLEKVIVLDREALELSPPGDPDRLMCLNNLSVHLRTRYTRHGKVEDLEEAIGVSRDALANFHPDGPERSTILNNLASSLYSRYMLFGGVEDLEQAIVFDREILKLCPPQHLNRPTYLGNLALHLSARYKLAGKIGDLNEGILVSRDALALHPVGHLDRSASLTNLALYLWARYNQLGMASDLHEAIVLVREGLALFAPGHQHRSASLSILALFLYSRYLQLKGMDDLDEAIGLDRESLSLCPSGHSERATVLNNLTTHIYARYICLGVAEDLEEAIVLAKDALLLCPPGHVHRSASLNNLGYYLYTRYRRLEEEEDLDMAVFLMREAIALRPLGHPDRSSSLNNLANCLAARYAQFEEIQDLEEAIVLHRETLALCPPGHPSRSISLTSLADRLFQRYTKLGKAEDREGQFNLYSDLQYVSQAVSSSDIFAAKRWIFSAEYFHHPTTLLAYETALSLLVRHIATLPSLPQHLGIFKELTSELAVDAFSACLRNQSPTKAIELLEQGRGVFWSQLTRLRSPLDDIVASGPEGRTLADEFTRLTSLIRNAINSPGSDQHDRVCRLNSELQTVVTNIRDLPALSRFLLPSLFPSLRHAASSGPIIIVNASKYSCDALVVFFDNDPVHIPLLVTKEKVREISSRLHALTTLAKRSDVTKDLGVLLRELWDHVVSPIVNFLRTTCARGSRIWWCPTAEFCLLPLHAAGPYRKGEQNLGNIYISSYTPTIAALIRARQPCSSLPGFENKRFIAVSQADATGTRKLLFTGTELASIGQLVDKVATFTCLEGQESCISRVTEEFSKNQWVHLACHGLPNRKQPFESAFALRDGRLTIRRIIQCNLADSEFVYLSACHTTVGDEESPDEVIHLASAMQFAGFRSVIGTMWAVDDAETSKITSVFYRYVADDLTGRLDHTRAAYALLKTMKTVDVPLDQRILYVHIGA